PLPKFTEPDLVWPGAISFMVMVETETSVRATAAELMCTVPVFFTVTTHMPMPLGPFLTTSAFSMIALTPDCEAFELPANAAATAPAATTARAISIMVVMPPAIPLYSFAFGFVVFADDEMLSFMQSKHQR